MLIRTGLCRNINVSHASVVRFVQVLLLFRKRPSESLFVDNWIVCTHYKLSDTSANQEKAKKARGLVSTILCTPFKVNALILSIRWTPQKWRRRTTMKNILLSLLLVASGVVLADEVKSPSATEVVVKQAGNIIESTIKYVCNTILIWQGCWLFSS